MTQAQSIQLANFLITKLNEETEYSQITFATTRRYSVLTIYVDGKEENLLEIKRAIEKYLTPEVEIEDKEFRREEEYDTFSTHKITWEHEK